VNKSKAFLNKKPVAVAIALLSMIPVLIGIATALYYIWGPGEGYLHSDCTDTLLWANASVESGKVFDESFRYAGLLPFSTVIWMIPLIKIFGYGMTAQNIAMSIFVLLFAGSLLALFRASGMSRIWASTSAFAVMMILSSSDKLREIMYGHTIYYSLGPVILFLMVALFLSGDRAASSLLSGEKKSTGMIVAAAAAGIAFAFMAGGSATDGGQIIIIGSLPAIAGIIAERLFNGGDKLISKKAVPAWAATAIFAAGSLIGIILLKIWKGDSIDAGYANAYSGWSDVSAWVDNARIFVKHYFTLIGVTTANKETLFSLKSIDVIIRILGGILILVIPCIMFVFYKKIESRGVRIMLWADLVVFAAVMFGFICGKLSGANWRLTPIVATSAAVSFMGIWSLVRTGLDKLPVRSSDSTEDTPENREAVTEQVKGGRVSVRVGACLLAASLLFPVSAFREIKKMPADYGRDNYNHELAAFLEEKGLEYGYASFWYCQTITILSDSKVKCREILADKSRGVYTDYYQSSKLWYTNQNYNEYFVVLTINEYYNVLSTSSWADMCKYKTAQYPALNEYGEEDESSGVDGFVITVFSVNVLDWDELYPAGK